MKTSILLFLAFNLSFAFAQTTNDPAECRAAFKYELNTQIVSIVPATALNFYDASYGNAVEWHWNFGDETSSTEQNPLHIYVLPFNNDSMKVMLDPYRTVTLRVVTADGCSSEYAETINIYDPFPADDYSCRAAWKYYQLSYDSVQQTATYQFNNYSEGDSLSYEWKFGDGYSSTEAEPQFTFDFSQPERKVCLKVTSPSGCSDIFCDAVWVNASGGDWVDPVDTIYGQCFVSFGYKVNYDVQTFAPALVLDFYSKVDGEAAKYLWDFGDGTYSEEANPMHIFNLIDYNDSIMEDVYPNRTVCLTISTKDGCTNSYCEYINIYNFFEPAVECNAYFKYYRPEDISTIPEIVPFKFVAAQENIIEYNWYFGNDSVSHEAEPIAYFDIFKQSEQVCLSLVTADSCMSKWCETIYFSIPDTSIVYPEPTCAYRFKYASSYPPYASACIGKVSAQVVDGDSLVETEYYYWLTPDGSMVEGPELSGLCPTNTYMVTALTKDGCKFSETFIFNSDGTVTVIPLNWWFTPYGTDVYVDFELPDSSYSVEWILCDGTVVYDQNVFLSQINCGTDDANMIVRNSSGEVVYTNKVGTATKVVAVEKNQPLKLYPNPVKDALYLQIDEHSMQTRSYRIVNMKGEIVQSGSLIQNNNSPSLINVAALHQGLYILKVDLGKLTISKSFIK